MLKQNYLPAALPCAVFLLVLLCKWVACCLAQAQACAGMQDRTATTDSNDSCEVESRMWSKFPERRREPRYLVSLPATVIFLGSVEATNEQPLATLGATRDISSSGLAIFVPTVPFSGDLTEAQRALKVVLALPAGYVIMLARRVWQKAPQAERPELGHLLAAQITEMGETDRTIYREYLQRLAAGAQAEQK